MIGFRDTNDFVNLGICKHEYKFTCHGCCRFTLNVRERVDLAIQTKDENLQLCLDQTTVVENVERCFTNHIKYEITIKHKKVKLSIKACDNGQNSRFRI